MKKSYSGWRWPIHAQAQRASFYKASGAELSAAMDKLTSRTRTAIELRELRELSTEEAARAMGLSVGGVKARVFHGRRKLRRLLKRESAWMSGKQSLRASRKANGLSRHQLVCSFGD